MNDSESVNILIRLKGLVDEASQSVSKLNTELNGKEVSANTLEYFQQLSGRFNQFYSYADRETEFDRVFKTSGAIGTYLKAIVNSLRRDIGANSANTSALLLKIGKIADEINDLIASRKVTFSPNEVISHREPKTDRTGNNVGKSALNAMRSLDDKFSSRESILTGKLDKLRVLVDSIDEQAKEKINNVNTLYQDTLSSLELKQKEVDDLLGTISAGVMAGDFEKTAKDEGVVADWLRYSALVCMLVIVFVGGSTIYELSHGTLRWDESLIRMLFSVVISIPAAYLARESSKHRNQRNFYLQKSLDLKAISPYLASLPLEEQHRLKSQIANRLFVPREGSSNDSDSYPINTHELLMKLIDKMEFKSK